MKEWITTDNHFDHKNIVEYCGRPEDYEERIIKNLSVVGDDDILFNLGDFSLGKRTEYWAERYMFANKAKKILILGNHDNKSYTYYYKLGFDFVCRRASIKRYGKRIVLSHRPRRFFTEHINIHGHMHNVDHRCNGFWDRKILSYNRRKGRMRLVSIENTDYMPVTLETVIK